MRRYHIALKSVSVLPTCGSLTSAGLLDPVSIERRVYALHEIGEGSQWVDYTASQDGIGVQPFSASVVAWDGTDPFWGTHQYATAQQGSAITASAISITGSANGTGVAYPYEGWHSSDAYSSLTETFVLTPPTPFTFSFGWGLSPLYTVYMSVYLTGPSGDVFREPRGAVNPTGTWATQGYLEPGQYQYYVKGEIEADWSNYPPGDRTISFSADFTLTPEPATLALAALGALPLVRRRKTRQ